MAQCLVQVEESRAVKPVGIYSRSARTLKASEVRRNTVVNRWDSVASSRLRPSPGAVSTLTG